MRRVRSVNECQVNIPQLPRMSPITSSLVLKAQFEVDLIAKNKSTLVLECIPVLIKCLRHHCKYGQRFGNLMLFATGMDTRISALVH
ncbi:hypothetical protein TNCV_3818971 [Trichonephila clavipes]|nr:hypothetical protein TNCV_3818971 [Trichonephila clavipes]